MYLDFHHHHSFLEHGIYNLNAEDADYPYFFSAGLHPSAITGHWQEDLERVKRLSLEKNCLAVGECGLDSLIETSYQLQKKVFEEQVRWAEEIRKPVIIHCVRRYPEIIELCRGISVAKVIHGFNRKLSLAKELIAEGFYLSFGNALLHSVSLQQTVRELPLERIFLETDDKELQISNLYETLAFIKQLPLEDISKQMTYNFNSFTNER